MKRLIIFLAVAIVLIGGMVLAGHGWSSKDTASPGMPMSKTTVAAKQDWTCNMHPWVHQDHPGPCPECGMPLTLATHKGTGTAIEIDPAVVQNMGVRTAPTTRGALTRTLRAVGMLDTPDIAQHEINLRISGWVEKLYANQEGMHVHQGDVLMDIYSPELQIAEEELIGAAAAQKAMDAKPSSSKSMDWGAGESRSLLDSARRKMKQWGIADEDIDAIANAETPPRTVPFRSPVDGEILEKMIVEGSAIQSGMKLMRLEDHSTLWLEAQVFEQQVQMMKVGQQVRATLDAFPAKQFTGSIDLIYPHLDHETRTVKVRATLENKDHQLRPGMYASAEITTDPLPETILIPREAVIDSGTRQTVFIVDSPGHFSPRNVRMGFTGDGDQVQILEGLRVGETVVTSGQFLMDVTSRTQEAMEQFHAPSMGK